MVPITRRRPVPERGPPVLRRRTASSIHPLVAEVGPAALLDGAPVAVLVVDESGTIVHRNAVASSLGASVAAERGTGILEALRATLTATVRGQQAYPYREVIEVSEGERHAEAEVWINRVGRAFVVVWDDATERHDTARVARELARDLSASSMQLATLGDIMSGTASQTAERTSLVICRGRADGREHPGGGGRGDPRGVGHGHGGRVGRAGQRAADQAGGVERADRRGEQADRLRRRADEPPRAQRHHRGGPRGRGRQGLRGR